MGRFASTIEFYARYREPYPPKFFETAAEHLALQGSESLLDIGCGPGLLSLGFAPYVETCTGIDPEAAMLDAARAVATEAGVAINLIHATIEQYSAPQTFDVITIGRALHWLNRDAALPVLERILPGPGHILICRAHCEEDPIAPWLKPYTEVRRRWSTPPPNENPQGRDPQNWFTGTRFAESGIVEITEHRQVTVADLIGRALSKSYTSPAMLGDRRGQFEAEITAALEPFVHRGTQPSGILEEKIVARAFIFERQPG